MSEGDDKPAKTEKMKFHFIKSNHFRVIHVDGAWGGVSPSGFIQMAVYSQRTAIPQVIEETVQIKDDIATKLPGEVRTGKEGIIREVEADLVMNIETAVALHAWLGNHIRNFAKLKPKPN